MKRIIKYIPLLCLLFTINSCDAFLDRDPIDELGAGAFYKNTEEVNQAVLACYNGLQTTMRYEWYLTELRSDNSRHYANGSTATSSKDIYAMDWFKVETTHPVNKNYWEAVYHNIANCNTVLQYLDVVDNAELKKQFKTAK